MGVEFSLCEDWEGRFGVAEMAMIFGRIPKIWMLSFTASISQRVSRNRRLSPLKALSEAQSPIQPEHVLPSSFPR